MNQKLFAVYLGGRALKCNTELHDVVFVVGETIEQTYERLIDKWFGSLRLHIDSWIHLQVVDGHRVTLQTEPSSGSKKLYFINLGGYQPGQFTELHANAFMVAESEAEVKNRARQALLRGMQQVHTDDLFDVDDCLEITEVDGYHLQLEATAEADAREPQNGYHKIPAEVIAAYAAQRGLPDRPR